MNTYSLMYICMHINNQLRIRIMQYSLHTAYVKKIQENIELEDACSY